MVFSVVNIINTFFFIYKSSGCSHQRIYSKKGKLACSSILRQNDKRQNVQKKIIINAVKLVICIYVPFLVISCLPLFILSNLKNKKNKWGVHPPFLLVIFSECSILGWFTQRKEALSPQRVLLSLYSLTFHKPHHVEILKRS